MHVLRIDFVSTIADASFVSLHVSFCNPPSGLNGRQAALIASNVVDLNSRWDNTLCDPLTIVLC